MTTLSPEQVWTNREGKSIKIKDMTDAHISNSIKCLERVIESIEENICSGYGLLSWVNGDAATYEIEKELSYESEDVADFRWWVRLLQQEQKRRRSKYQPASVKR